MAAIPSAVAASKPTAPTITIAVDASQAPRKIFHAQLSIPAAPGTLTLYYPKWIPGEHGPTGPIEDLAGLKFTGNGKTLKWRRDLQDGWTFHVEVPAGVSSVDASLDFISPVGEEGIYTAAASATDRMTVLSWNTLLLYPAGWTTDELTYQASVRLPSGWTFGTPLPIANQSGTEIKFKPGLSHRFGRFSGNCRRISAHRAIKREPASGNGHRGGQRCRARCAAGTA